MVDEPQYDPLGGYLSQMHHSGALSRVARVQGEILCHSPYNEWEPLIMIFYLCMWKFTYRQAAGNEKYIMCIFHTAG